MLKRSLAFGPAVLVLIYGLWIGPKYDRYVLPAFDGFIYDAMADHPRVFTLAPWGYRILAPWIVHLLPTASAAEGYFWLTLVCLAATLVALDSWLRRLGFAPAASALACAAFALSPPIRLMLDYQVLVDPLALWIVAMFLRELCAPRLLPLAALLTAGALTKEACLVPAFMLPILLIPARGIARGWLATGLVVAPALGAAILLRLTWGEARPALEAPILELLVERATASGSALLEAAALSGLVLPALIGLGRERSAALRIQGGVTWAATFLAALANPYHFSAPDLTRLSALAWPALLPLALSGLGFAREEGPRRAEMRPRMLVRLLSGATLLGCGALVFLTDPFRHAPEDAWNNPIRYLARSREALKTAAMLEEGGTLSFDSRSGRYAGPITERFNLTEGRQHRWFLWDGFGPEAVFEAGEPEFRGEGRLLLPLLVPRPVRMEVMMGGPDGARVTVGVAGREVAVFTLPGPARFVVPADVLIRGDNLLELRTSSGEPLRLIRFDARVDKSSPAF